MAIETVNTGTVSNDGTGDHPRAAFGKINRSLQYLASQLGLSASASDFWTNLADGVATVRSLWSAQVPTALTDAPLVALDMNTGTNFAVTLNGNRLLAAPTNAKRGQSGVIEITQGAGGNRTLDFAPAWDFGLVGPSILSTGAGKTDLVSYYVLSTTGPVVRCWFSKAG